MKTQRLLRSLAIAGAILIWAFANSIFSVFPEVDSLNVKVDTIEDKRYPSVKIGNQEWMTENLNEGSFRNGDPIPEVKTSLEWKKYGEEKKPASCYFDNDPSNEKLYGKLYNWYAVNDPRGLAPEGWHLPSDREWTVLTAYLGEQEIRDETEEGVAILYTPKAGGKMKSTGTHYWKSPNEQATNSSGFSGLPGGIRYTNGRFDYFGSYGGWWSSSESGVYNALSRYLYFTNSGVLRGDDLKSYGLSVRCLKD